MPWKELPHAYRIYMQIATDAPRRLVRMTRTATALPREATTELLTRFYAEMERVLPRRERAALRLLVDSQKAPRMFDPTAEPETNDAARSFYGDFQRTAFLIRTPIGLLQMRRIIKTMGLTAAAFVDEVEAMTYLVSSEPSA